jgi:hypothetical protein
MAFRYRCRSSARGCRGVACIWRDRVDELWFCGSPGAEFASREFNIAGIDPYWSLTGSGLKLARPSAAAVTCAHKCCWRRLGRERRRADVGHGKIRAGASYGGMRSGHGKRSRSGSCRAISDPLEFSPPTVLLDVVRPDGSADLARLLPLLLRRVLTVGTLLRLAADSRAACSALASVARLAGTELGIASRNSVSSPESYRGSAR